MEIALDNIRQAEGILDELNGLKENIENRVNLSQVAGNEKRVLLTGNKIMRICLIAGLNVAEKRSMERINNIQLSKSSIRIPSSFFTHNNLRSLYSALLKIRYRDFKIDWNDNPTVSRIIAAEMFRGRDYLLNDNNLNNFLLSITPHRNMSGNIPVLELIIGEYDNEMEASLNINGKSITNTQILIAGSTGSGKTNLLAVLINQFRRLSVETTYPVNFLLFDYKGEFSDPANNHWLTLFDVDKSCILNPIERPLPFTPFKDFTGKTLNEINLYSSEMATALCALEKANISANMSNRLSEAIVDAYKKKVSTQYIFAEPYKSYAYFALFQELNGYMIFDPLSIKDDIKCFAAVATSLNRLYPHADRSRNLYNMVIKGMKNTREVKVEPLEIPEDKIHEVSIIDIPLNDLKGVTHHLTDLKGKVVLIDFTVYGDAASGARNLLLRELYDKYASQGLEIYQISLDADEHFWKTASDNLPWICVRDPQGVYSSYVKIYGVEHLPTSFLVNRDNELSLRVGEKTDLEAEIKKLL